MATENVAKDNELDEFVDELKPGTELLHGQYTISRFLNHGGFGITYLAKDSLERDVVIKECFPGAFCRRSKTIVGARSRAHQNEFKSIVKLFIQEARSLSKLVHPNIVGVHQVFEDNDTAYMAIDYVDGRDMLEILEDKSVQLDPSDIVSMTKKLLSAVGFIHENNMLHRDISPDNILLNKDGEPVLIDFGAAREQASKTSRALSALRVVKDGYSPQEFYITGSEQGPWSDLYALGASLYHIITGEAATDSQARLAAIAEGREDPYTNLAGRFDGYPEGFLEAIDKAMQPIPKRRVQTAADWLAMFDNSKPRLAVVDGDPTETISQIVREQSRDSVPAAKKEEPSQPVMDATAETPAPQTVRDPEPAQDAPESRAESDASLFTAAPTQKKGGKTPILLGGGLFVAGAIGFAVLNMGGSDDTAAEASAGNTSEVVAASMPAETSSSTNDASQTVETPIVETDTDLAAATDVPAVEDSESASSQAASDTESESAAPTETAAVPTTSETGSEAAATEGSDSTPTPEPETDASSSVAASEENVDESTNATDTAASNSRVTVTPPVTNSQAAPGEDTTAQASETETDSESTAASGAVVAENQISFALWDIVMPFTSSLRTISNENLALITRIPQSVDTNVVGGWIDQGVGVYGVNGAPLPNNVPLETLILNELQVDPDGFTRAVVEYRARGSQESELGLLAVPVVRNIGLQNGTLFHISHDGTAWQTSVISMQDRVADGLREGDIVLAEEQTGQTLNSDSAMEELLQTLVAEGHSEAILEVERDGKTQLVTMPLATE